MTPSPRPTFRDAYLVVNVLVSEMPVGVVRRDRNVWRMYRFGVTADQQPREAFATREEAGTRLLELSAG